MADFQNLEIEKLKKQNAGLTFELALADWLCSSVSGHSLAYATQTRTNTADDPREHQSEHPDRDPSRT